MVNGSILVFIAVYLLAVVFRGNSLNFVNALKQDLQDDADGRAGFLKWFAALLLLYALATNAKLRPIVNPLIWIVLVGLALTAAQRNTGLLETLSNVFRVPWRLPE